MRRRNGGSTGGASDASPATGYDAVDRVEAMLHEQQLEMERLARDIAKTDSAFANSSAGEFSVDRSMPTYSYGPATAADDNWKPFIDPMRVVRGVLDSKGLIVALTLLGGAAGILVALSTPKQYHATAEIVIDPRDLKIGDRPLTDVNGLPSDSTIALVENQVRVLSSGTVLSKVADELNLESDPQFNGTAGGLSLNPLNLIRSLLTRSDGAPDPGRLRAVTVSNLGEHIWVERTGRSFVVLVNAVSDNGETSAKIANKMVDVFIETSGDMQSNSAGRANSEVVAQLERLRKDLEAAEQKVEKYRSDNDLVGAQGRLMTDEEILKLNDQLGAARARTLELNARADSARRMSIDAIVGGAIPEAAASGMITELRSQYSAAKQEADRVSVRLGPLHPSYQAAQAQVAAISAQISTELKRISAQVQAELRRSVQTEQDLAARLAQLKVRQGDVSNELVALRELERDVQAKRSVYEAYLLRANETSEQEKINSSNVSIISRAYPPLKSTGASRAVIAVTGLLFGLIAGFGLGIVRGIVGGLRDAMGGNGGDKRQTGDGLASQPRRSAVATSKSKREREAPTAKTNVTEEIPVDPNYPPHGYAPYPHPVAAPGHTAPQSYAVPSPHITPVYHGPVPTYPPQPVAPYQQPAPAYPYPQSAPTYPYAPPAYAQTWAPPPPAPPVYAPPPAPSFYAQPIHQQAQPYPQPPQPAPQYVQPSAQSARDLAGDSLSQMSESVREFRDAVRELAETRLRRRYF